VTGVVWSFEPSPDGTQMLVTADGGGSHQPWLVPLNGDPARMIKVAGSVQRCVWHPDGRRFIALVDPDGREDNQIVVVDPATGAGEPVTAHPGTRNELGMPYTTGSDPVSPDGRWLAFATNRRAGDSFDIVLRDLAAGQEQTVLESGRQVPADRYFPLTFSWDSRRLLVIRLHQNTEQDLYAVDVTTGQVSLLTPHEGPAKYFAVAARPEGVYLCATRDGDFTGLARLDDDGTTHWIDTPEHDIDCATLSADGGTLAWAVNEDGYTTFRQCAIQDGRPRAIHPVTGLPPGAYTYEKCFDGRALRLSPDGGTLFAVDGTGALWAAGQTAGQTASRAADRAEITARRLAGPDPASTPPRPDVVRFPSTDGVLVSALVFRPSGTGPFPVVLNIHGGPESQFTPIREPVTDMLVARGIAVLATNIRGSSGYGLRYQRLIYRDWGGGDVEDLRAAAEFIRAQPWADAGRMGVYGASYGGFASLSCLTRLPEYWRAGAAACAVSDLAGNVRDFPPTWRRRSRDWVGDIDDPGDLRRLIQASPITHADGLRAPLLLVHGTNDARVTIQSCDALYERLTALGKDVTYQRLEGAGHEFTQQEPDSEAMIADWLAANLVD
jgi:dipeptidyl aminopeptidase/acylaminoacyl peptidase